MSFDYSKSQATAARLIARFGQFGTLKQTAISGGDPWDGASGAKIGTDTTVTVVLLDYSDKEREGTSILQGDRRVYMSASGLSVEPKADDKILADGATYSVIAVMPLNPAGTVVFYELQVRK